MRRRPASVLPLLIASVAWACGSSSGSGAEEPSAADDVRLTGELVADFTAGGQGFELVFFADDDAFYLVDGDSPGYARALAAAREATDRLPATVHGGVSVTTYEEPVDYDPEEVVERSSKVLWLRSFSAHPSPATEEESDEPITRAPQAVTERHLEVRWDQLADPHSMNALIVRTVDEWEELFVGAPPETIDFSNAIVVGVVQSGMARVHVDEVRHEGGEVVVSTTVELPNPSCGEAPLGSLDLMVIEKVDMHIRFDIQRRTATC
jgi:hypothetical protein